jgi:adenylate cyclase
MASDTDITIAFVDLAGFTALTETHGDEEAADLAERFADMARQALGPDDRLVKTIGDAVLLTADDPTRGLELVTRVFKACYATSGFAVPRAGMHHGNAVERGDDIFGAAVNLAARVAGQAFGGQLLGTESIAAAARERHIEVVALGSFALRNIAEPVELFDIVVVPQPEGGAVDPVCRMHVERSHAAGRLRHQDADYWFCSLECVAAFAGAPDRYS